MAGRVRSNGSWHGFAGFGVDNCGMVRNGRRGKPGLGESRLGRDSYGAIRQDLARQARLGFACQRMIWLGVTWRGRLGVERLCEERQGGV